MNSVCGHENCMQCTVNVYTRSPSAVNTSSTPPRLGKEGLARCSPKQALELGLPGFQAENNFRPWTCPRDLSLILWYVVVEKGTVPG